MGNRIFSLIYILFSALVLTGCNKGFSSATTTPAPTIHDSNVGISTTSNPGGTVGTGTTSGTGTGTTSGSTGSGTSSGSTGTATTSPGNTGTGFNGGLATGNLVQTANGTFDYYLNKYGDGAETIFVEFNIPYGRIYSAASSVVRLMAPQACQIVPGIQNSAPSAYNPGEIPCGVIQDSNWKQLIDLQVPSQFIQAGGFNIVTSYTDVPVMLSRSTRSGNYQQPDLDSKTNATFSSSSNWGDDVAVLYKPSGDDAHMEICVNVPGGEVTAPQRYISATADQWILGIDISYGSWFTVTPGNATYDYGRACLNADVSWSAQGWFTPFVNFSVKTAPYLQNVSYQGLNIQIDDWLLNAVNDILSFFGTNFKQDLINSLTQTGNNFAQNDIETGAWFQQMGGNQLLQSASNSLNGQLQNVVGRLGLPTSATDVQNMLMDKCNLEALTLSPNWTADMQTFCKTVIPQLDILIEPFAVDKNGQAAGCYDFYANVNQTVDGNGNPKWWATQCHYTARFNIRLGTNIVQYEAQLQQLLQDHLDALDNIPADWQSQLQQLGLGEYGTYLLLQQLQQQGYTSILNSDWSQGIPPIVQQIVTNLAAQGAAVVSAAASNPH